MSCEERGPAGGPREVTDPQTMRALTHPVRQALIELLVAEGPLTATQAGERIGEPPNTCSFHFRQLAKYGFVEEAGRGPGRTRPWKLTHAGMRFSDLHDDAETTLAARALDRMLRERYFTRLQAFYDTRSSYPRRWQEAATDNQHVFYLTVEELEQLNQELTASLLTRFRERLTDPSQRPPGAVPVEMLVMSYPMAVPPPDGSTAGPAS